MNNSSRVNFEYENEADYLLFHKTIDKNADLASVDYQVSQKNRKITEL